MSSDIRLMFTSKEDLIAALKAKRTAIRRIDRENKAKHREAERAYLQRFRGMLREALKWDYEKLAAEYGQVSIDHRRSRPRCPQVHEVRLDRILAQLEFSVQENYTVTADGPWSVVHELLTIDMPQDRTAC